MQLLYNEYQLFSCAAFIQRLQLPAGFAHRLQGRSACERTGAGTSLCFGTMGSGLCLAWVRLEGLQGSGVQSASPCG